ncbi:polysaccharide biosynthesis protein GtrA [Bacillus sp. M6-12]|uniref:GtrA family protein n=1 Tax=Bacillus sp. M6-12 TaxID=2054166 RepID=UPI000C77BE26|nr:GtrA family protein [Bacillus sp. M6-12]PLS17581.1 polysaccharide biosynthesis protein GtrA [Bacillus sp. M6-12]
MIEVKCLKQTNSFTRFLLVGIFNTCIGLSAVYFFLNALGFSYWISTFIGNSIGAAVSFFLNRSFTFHSSVSAKSGIPKFIAVILICYFGAYSISEFMAEYIDRYMAAFQLISKNNLAVLMGTGFYTIANYAGQKIFVFRE